MRREGVILIIKVIGLWKQKMTSKLVRNAVIGYGMCGVRSSRLDEFYSIQATPENFQLTKIFLSCDSKYFLRKQPACSVSRFDPSSSIDM